MLTMILKFFIFAVIGIGVAFLADLIRHLDFHVHYYKHHPGVCKHVEGIEFGSEDFEVLSNGLTFITSGLLIDNPSPEYMEFVRENDIKGRVFLLDLENPKNAAKELKIRPSADFDPAEFGPHGISILEDQAKGEHLLYTVSHVLEKADRIEKFKYLPKTQELLHMKSFFSDFLREANDILVTGPDTFYVTNFFYYNKGIMSIFETLFRWPLGNVVYFNGSDFSVITSGHYAPNGLTMTKDGKVVYVAAYHNKGIVVFERSSNNSLHQIQDIHLGVMPDNLHLSRDSKTLYIGCHPIVWKIVQHLMDPTYRSPSMVLSVSLKDGAIVEDQITELFYDHGDFLPASSISYVYRDKLIVGTIFDKLALCELSQPTYNA